MNKKYIAITVVVLLVIGLGIYFSTSQNSNNTASTPTSNSAKNVVSNPTVPTPNLNPAPAANLIIHNVSITGFAFVPATITVKKGETIVWTNKDATVHTVTGGDLQSSPLGQNQTYSFAYDKIGTYSYHCSIHPSMKGTVIVTN